MIVDQKIVPNFVRATTVITCHPITRPSRKCIHKNEQKTSSLQGRHKKRTNNMFMDRLSSPHNFVHCVRMLLGSSSYKRKLPISPIGCWVDLHPTNDDCDDSDISDSEDDDDEDVAVVSLQESRWSSNSCCTTSHLLVREPQKPLRKVTSVDSAMTLPTRKPSSCDLEILVL